MKIYLLLRVWFMNQKIEVISCVFWGLMIRVKNRNRDLSEFFKIHIMLFVFIVDKSLVTIYIKKKRLFLVTISLLVCYLITIWNSWHGAIQIITNSFSLKKLLATWTHTFSLFMNVVKIKTSYEIRLVLKKCCIH